MQQMISGSEPQIEIALSEAIPRLRAFAISLTGNVDRADDLVQEAVLKALSNFGQFERGTSLQAWMFTILRNVFYSDHRRRSREIEDPDGAFAAELAVMPDQLAKLDFADMRVALAKLAPEQREAIVLVAAEGLTYQAAADVCGVAVGTIKSRINRARIRLAELLEEERPCAAARERVRDPVVLCAPGVSAAAPSRRS